MSELLDDLERQSRLLNKMNDLVRQLIRVEGWDSHDLYNEFQEMVDDALEDM